MVVVGLLKSIAWVGKLLKVVKGLLMVVRLELNKWVVRLELDSGPSVLLMELSLVLESRAVSVLVIVLVLVLENRVVSVLVMEPSLVLEDRYIWVLLMEFSLVLENSSVRNSSQMFARSGWVVFTFERKSCQVSTDLRVLLLVSWSEAWHRIIRVSSTNIPGSRVVSPARMVAVRA